ncbi:hypothetical protein EDB84DRAFT_1436481 [Lactarius hengduanensis]|nr:hypothetical protein EDB84DRAFT_1436481 [Lactarius hengduanensis]
MDYLLVIFILTPLPHDNGEAALSDKAPTLKHFEFAGLRLLWISSTCLTTTPTAVLPVRAHVQYSYWTLLCREVVDGIISLENPQGFMTAAATTITVMTSNAESGIQTTGIVTPDTIEDDCDYDYATGARETLATVVLKAPRIPALATGCFSKDWVFLLFWICSSLFATLPTMMHGNEGPHSGLEEDVDAGRHMMETMGQKNSDPTNTKWKFRTTLTLTLHIMMTMCQPAEVADDVEANVRYT